MLEGTSGAQIHAVVTEAGYFAIRDKRVRVRDSDFLSAIQKFKAQEGEDKKEYLNSLEMEKRIVNFWVDATVNDAKLRKIRSILTREVKFES